MNRIEVIDQITTGESNKLSIGSTMTYLTAPVDIQPNDIPCWSLVQTVAPPMQLDPIPAGTAIPFFIPISSYPAYSEVSEVVTKATSYDPSTGVPTGRLQRWYDMPVEDQDTNNDGTGTFTGWNVYGHDDGSGNFKEDTTIILKG